MKVQPPKLEPLGPQSDAQDGTGQPKQRSGWQKTVPSQVGHADLSVSARDGAEINGNQAEINGTQTESEVKTI